MYPLKASANGRYLIDQNNVPVLIVGDDGYSIFSQLTTAEATTYLQDRAARGFNTVWGGLTDNAFANNSPHNANGDAVFTGANFTTPNSAWFSHCDAVITAAANVGIQMVLTPLYLGNPSAQGWGAQVAAAANADLTSFGTYIGNRYKTFPNIIWMIGGDIDPTTVSGQVGAFASALATADTTHLITAHNARGDMATTHWGTATGWLTLNDTYTTDLNSAVLAGTAYTQSPTLPFFQGEAYNENEHAMTAQGLRAQMYWTVLSGGCGHIFGNCPVWGFDYSGIGAFCTASAWQSNLDSNGARGIACAARVLTLRQWYSLVPDTAHTVVTAGYGTIGTSAYVASGQSTDKTLVLAYIPTGATITVNMTRLSGVARARWYDPTNGAYQDVSGQPFMNDGSRTFAPPATNNAGDADWVLVIEALDPGMPGSWMNV